MKTILRSAAVAAAVLVGGCTSVEISSSGSLKGVDVKGAGGNAERVVMLGNECYYLFHAWPIVGGDLSWDAKTSGIGEGISFFTDELKGDRMANVIFRYAESRNCDLVDLVINDKQEAPIGLFGILDWFNTVVAYKNVTYSGVLRPRK